jgi:hypothetical protein
MKYLGTLDHPVAKTRTDHSKKGDNVVIEISPKFFSTWVYGERNDPKSNLASEIDPYYLPTERDRMTTMKLE